jgi:hypothetical protein
MEARERRDEGEEVVRRFGADDGRHAVSVTADRADGARPSSFGGRSLEIADVEDGSPRLPLNSEGSRP